MTALLIIGDLVVLYLFIMLGRLSHGESLNFLAVSEASAPFVVGWLIAVILVGAYKLEKLDTYGGAVQKTVLAWIIGMPLGFIIRALMLQRWFHWSFIAITMAGTLLFLLVWRLAFTYILKKKGGSTA